MEMPETVIDLCMECHEKIHSYRILSWEWKKKATQNLLDAGWTKEKILEKVGRYYGD